MKKILLGTAAAGIMALSIGLPTVAKAGVVPSPEPSQQIVTPYPSYDPHHVRPVQFRPEQFEIALDQVGGVFLNTVRADGPVRFRNGDDTTISQFRDLLSDRGANAVNFDHNRLAPPIAVYLNTCSAVFLQQSPWQFNGGRGIYARERGNGTVTLTGIVSAHQRNFQRWNWNPSWNYNQNMNWNFVQPINRAVCPLRGLSQFDILREVQRQILGGTPRIQFDQFSFNLQGVGVASAPSHPIVRPCPYPTYATPSQVASLDAYRGDHPTPDPTSTCDAAPAPVRLAA